MATLLIHFVTLMRANHDMGGLAAGKIVPREHTYEPWEKRVDALMMLLSHQDRQMLKVDELRRHIETLGPQAYERMSYYERWMHAICQTLIERGVITLDELGRKMEQVKARGVLPDAGQC